MARNLIYPTHKIGTKIYPHCYVSEQEKDIEIQVFPSESGYSFKLPKKVARLLARRILQCLSDKK